MDKNKLIVFLLFAFLPMVAVGLILHFSLFTVEMETPEQSAILTRTIFSAGAMLIPLLAVVFTQLIFREPMFRNLGILFKINRWWFVGWLLMPVVALAVLGVTLLMPGARWSPDGEAMQAALSAFPESFGVWGVIAVTLLSGMLAGLTLNALVAFGEEVAWRGFLMKEFRGKKFLVAALCIGIVWGLWHAPLILNGHNYPQHPVAGVFMMVVFCLLLTPMLMYFRQKSGSVFVAAVMHGTLNGVVGLSALVVAPENDLLYGASGLAGFIVLLAVDVCLFLFDRYVTREKIFTGILE